MPVVSHVLGGQQAYSLLNAIYEKQDVISREDVRSLLVETGASDDILLEIRDLGAVIETKKGFYVSSFGRTAILLLRALNGDEDIAQALRKIGSYSALGSYELLTEDVTGFFLERLCMNPDFIRVLICSPWIRLEKNHLTRLEGAISQASQLYGNLQIRVLTLPPDGYRNWPASRATFHSLIQCGAQIGTLFDRANHGYRLHTKLYLVEPGPLGGAHYAIVGSENLTGRSNVELAIKIENDTVMMRNLNLYFYALWERCKLLQEV